MATIGERLKDHWLRHDAKVRLGATRDQIQIFESRFGVKLPKDMEDYFSVVNGTEVKKTSSIFYRSTK